MESEQNGVNFLILMLITSGGIRLTLTARYSLQNVTKWVGREAIIICDAETNNNANQLFWNKYDPQQTNIYNPNNPNAIDSNKYSTGNGNNTLTVKNVKLEDAATYCCAYNPGDDYCANLVVIDSLKVSVDPSDRVQAGEAVNITCVLTYDSPLKDVNSPLPLSEDQDLHLSLFIGDQKIEKGGDGIEVVGSATHYHSKTLSFNRIIEKSDAGKQLSCKVFSQNPQIDNYTNGDLNVFDARQYYSDTHNISDTTVVVIGCGGFPLMSVVLPVLLISGFIGCGVFAFVKAYNRRKSSSPHVQTQTRSTPAVNTWSSSHMETDPYWIQTEPPPPYTTVVESGSMPYETEEAPPLYSSLIASEPKVYQALVRTTDVV